MKSYLHIFIRCVIIRSMFRKGGKVGMEKPKRINVIVDEDLHKELKIASAITGVSIKQYVADAVREKMKKDKIPILKERE